MRLSLIGIMLLLVVSLAIKGALFGREPRLDQNRLSQDIAAALSSRGYGVAIEQRPYFPPVVTARRGACRIMVRDSSFVGQEILGGNRLRLSAAGPIHILYEGAYHQSLPAVLPELRWRMQRELARLGIATTIEPVLLVAAHAPCRPSPAFAGNLRLRVR